MLAIKIYSISQQSITKKYLKELYGVFFSTFSAMSLFASFMVLLLILVEVAPPSAASVPRLGTNLCFIRIFLSLINFTYWEEIDRWLNGRLGP